MAKKKYFATQDFHSNYLRRTIGKGAFKKGEKIELDAKTVEMFSELFSDKESKEDKPPSGRKPKTPTGAAGAGKEK